MLVISISSFDVKYLAISVLSSVTSTLALEQSLVIVLVAIRHDFDQLDMYLDLRVSPQCIPYKSGSNLQIDHFESATDNPCQNIGVPEFISELWRKDDEVVERVVLEDERALLLLTVPVLNIRVDAQEHLERLFGEHVHSLSEAAAGDLIRGFLPREKIIDHSTPHIEADLFELLIDLLCTVVIRLSDQLADEDSVGQRQKLTVDLRLLVEHLFTYFRVLGVLFLLCHSFTNYIMNLFVTISKIKLI